MKKKDDRYLLAYRRNVFSQNGEDGVLMKIFSMLAKSNSHWAVEFGAWDGLFSSNTANFIKNHGWSGVYIEPDNGRFKNLLKNHTDNPKVHCIQEFISIEGKNRLDKILKGVKELPHDFDLLSIDVDSCDYYIWNSLMDYRPKVVIIEFNPTIPLDYDYVQPPDFSVHDESNLGILVKLGKKKGYELVSCVENNAIFLRKEFFPRLGIVHNEPEILFEPFGKVYQTSIWQGYDGTLHLIGYNKLLVHNVTINEERIQVLPKFLRFFPGQTHPLLQIFKKFYYQFPIIPRIMNILLSGTTEAPKLS